MIFNNMKKTLFLTVALSLVLGTVAFAKAENLEKISHPSELRNFTKIIKKDKSLWGIRLKKEEKEERKEKKEEKREEKKNDDNQTLEKISSLSDVKYFTKIRKIGTSLWGIRKEAKVNAVNKIEAAAIPCVKEAIDTKDASLKTVFSAFSARVTTALDARNVCQKSALDAASQLEANKTCVTTFKNEIKSNNETANTARKEALKVYNEKLKECVKLQTPASTTPATLNLNDGSDD